MKFSNLSGVLRVVAVAAVVTGSAANVAMADAAKEPITITPPTAGKGKVVFWRPSAFAGSMIRCTVRENEKMVGRIMNGEYFESEVEPGVHKFTAATERKDEMSVMVEPDKISYVSCKIEMGFWAGRPNLAFSSQPEFFGESANLRPLKPGQNEEQIAKDEKTQKILKAEADAKAKADAIAPAPATPTESAPVVPTEETPAAPAETASATTTAPAVPQ